ncbi:MAG: TIGR02099 family protein [Hydrogenophaga sp.]|nr:TIGR02099 family protein [Hydrogenophaga sp.]
MSGPSTGDNAAADWFFSQREFAIRHGTVRWTDDLRQRAPLALGDLEFVARNTARQHDFRLDATPPAEWGERLSLRALMRQPLLSLQLGSAGPRWKDWDGELFADFTRVDVGRLRGHVDLSEWNADVAGGQGALKVWGEVRRGRLVGATAQMALRDVQARLGADLPELALRTVDGTVNAQWAGRDWSVGTTDLQFQTAEGETWPGGQVQVRHTADPGSADKGLVELSADRVDLAAFTAIATRLPVGQDILDTLGSVQPRGTVRDLAARWRAASPAAQGSASAWQARGFQAKGRVEALALQGAPSGRLSASGNHPLPGRPGVEGASVDFDIGEAGGRASIRIADGALLLPDVFEEPRVPLTELQAEAVWRVQGERIEVDLTPVRLGNADFDGTARVQWRTGDPTDGRGEGRFPGVLDLSATLSRADATRVHRYLPVSVGASARRYLREALVGAGTNQIRFRVRGAVREVPFNLPGEEGEFRISASVRDAGLVFVPGYLQADGEAPWPRLEQVSGNLLLDRTALRIDALSAGIAGVPGVRLSGGALRIDRVDEEVPRLRLNARAQGEAAPVLDVLKASPLNDFTGRALAQARMSGPVEIDFGLLLPIGGPDESLPESPRTEVRGSVVFTGNTVQITPDSPVLEAARGTLRFNRSGFDITDASAGLFGGSVRFEGGMQPTGDDEPTLVRFRGQGEARVERLREAGLGQASHLLQRASGSTRYTAELAFRGGTPEIKVASALEGVELALPAPLNKAAADLLPLRFENTVLTSRPDRALSDRLLLTLGEPAAPLLAVQYERDLRGSAPVALRGSVAVGLDAGESAPMPARGVLANLQLDDFDVDAWRSALAPRPVPPPGSTLLEPLAQPAAAPTTSDAASSYLPTVFAVRAQRIQVDGRSYNRVVVGGSREGPLWRANVNADELNGYVEYRPADGASDGSVYARLARLNLPPSTATDMEQLLQQPSSVPALDIAVQDLILSNRRLGQVEIDAVNVGGAGRVREWRLNRLTMRVPEARFSATGNWASLAPGADSGPRSTALNFRLDIEDSGQLLARFGRAGTVRGGQGRIEGRIGWLGSPLALDYSSLSGQLRADVAAGQFLKVDPGAAKLLGVLSLQALPRRLVLDFRDVFSDGFAFDFVRGDARIEKGVLYTNNLQMKGVNAAVLMEGTADIGREAQDLKVVVVPEINAGTAALIATAINPAVGLGTFLAQFLLREPLQSATTQEFHITGSWADPQVEKVAIAPPVGAPPPSSTPLPLPAPEPPLQQPLQPPQRQPPLPPVVPAPAVE